MFNIISMFALVVMTVVSFANFSGIKIAGLSIIIGITLFIINNRMSKKDGSSDIGLNVKSIGTHFKNKTLWFFVVLPLIMNIVCFTLAMLFLPEFLEHISDRTEVMLSFDKLLLLILQLGILALGEEIAWRGFFQKQLNKWLPIIPTLILTSFVFSIGHLAFGNIAIVSYDLLFIFINSVLYGFLFYKTNNIWISTISHFISNLFSILFLSFF